MNATRNNNNNNNNNSNNNNKQTKSKTNKKQKQSKKFTKTTVATTNKSKMQTICRHFEAANSWIATPNQLISWIAVTLTNLWIALRSPSRGLQR